MQNLPSINHSWSLLASTTSLGLKTKALWFVPPWHIYNAELEWQQLQASTDLYAEVYAEEPDLQELTESALTGWPE